MEVVELISNSDDTLVFTPLNDGVVLPTSIVTRAVCTVGDLVLDTSTQSTSITWLDGVFTVNFEGACPIGTHYVFFRVFYTDSTEGVVVVHPKLQSASMKIKCAASE